MPIEMDFDVIGNIIIKNLVDNLKSNREHLKVEIENYCKNEKESMVRFFNTYGQVRYCYYDEFLGKVVISQSTPCNSFDVVEFFDYASTETITAIAESVVEGNIEKQIK